MKNTIAANSERIKTERQEIELELVIDEPITPIADNLISQLPEIKPAASTETPPVFLHIIYKISKRVGLIVTLFIHIFSVHEK